MVTTITIRGFHCDVYGHVNNARYLEFLEEARWDYVTTVAKLNSLGEQGLGFIVAAINIEYRRPVGLGDVVEIHSQMAGVSEKRAIMRQRICNQANGKLVAEAQVSFAIVDLETKRAVPLTGELRDWLSSAADNSGGTT